MTVRFKVWGRYPIEIRRDGLTVSWRMPGELYMINDQPCRGSGSFTYRNRRDANAYWAALTRNVA